MIFFFNCSNPKMNNYVIFYKPQNPQKPFTMVLLRCLNSSYANRYNYGYVVAVVSLNIGNHDDFIKELLAKTEKDSLKLRERINSIVELYSVQCDDLLYVEPGMEAVLKRGMPPSDKPVYVFYSEKITKFEFDLISIDVMESSGGIVSELITELMKKVEILES